MHNNDKAEDEPVACPFIDIYTILDSYMRKDHVLLTSHWKLDYAFLCYDKTKERRHTKFYLLFMHNLKREFCSKGCKGSNRWWSYKKLKDLAFLNVERLSQGSLVT